MPAKKIFMIAPHAYGVEQAICSGLRTLGFDVLLVNTRNRLALAETLSIKISKRTPIGRGLFNRIARFYLERDNRQYLRLIREFRPDLLFVIKGETLFPDTLRAIKHEFKIPCLAYIWDCPFYSYGAGRADIYRVNNFKDGMLLYEHIFVYDPHYVTEISKHGAASVSYLPLAADIEQYGKSPDHLQHGAKFDYDICFVGSPYPNRIEILDQLSEFDLAVFGDGWKRWYAARMKKLPRYYKGLATGEKVLEAYRASKIVLNIHDPEAVRGVNSRTFDIPASGAFEMVDFKPELEKFFRIGEELACYHNVDELKKLIRAYLDNEPRRLAVSAAGRKRVLAEHTWEHRVREIADTLRKQGLEAV